MPKAKHGPALFDLLAEEDSETPNGLKIQKRSLHDQQRPPKPAERREPESNPPETLRIAESTDTEPEGEARFLELSNERVRLSFTSKTAAMAFFVIVVVLVGAFETGRRFGYNAGLGSGYLEGRASYAAEAASEIEIARNQAPATHLVSDLMESEPLVPTPAQSPAEILPSDSGQSQWVRGYTYIVAQEFPRPDSGDIAKAQAFLAEHGIETAPVQYQSGSVQLITTQGYNHLDPTQKLMANELLKKLHAIGAKYFAGGGGYKLEGYFKTLKRDSW